MSLTPSVPNTFGTVTGTAKTGDLDTNFTALVNFLLDPRSKVPFIDDTGSANAVVLALSPAIVGTLASNPYVIVWFKAAASNTGASNLTLNGTTKPFKKYTKARTNPVIGAGLSELETTDLMGGGIYGAVYQASGDLFLLINPTALTQVEGLLSAGSVASGDLTGTYPGPTLTTSGVSAGDYGSSSAVPVLHIDAKGRVTTATTAAITATGIGVGQTWQAVTRVAGTAYQNATGIPIQVSVRCNQTGGDVTIDFRVGPGTANPPTFVVMQAGTGPSNPTQRPQFSVIIPPTHYYLLSSNASLEYWTELR